MSNPNPKNEMDYEITIAFSKNEEMVYPLNNKTEKEAKYFLESVIAQFPEAEVTMEGKTNIFA